MGLELETDFRQTNGHKKDWTSGNLLCDWNWKLEERLENLYQKVWRRNMKIGNNCCKEVSLEEKKRVLDPGASGTGSRRRGMLWRSRRGVCRSVAGI